jgi:Zn-dependent protease with chaperone function
MNLLRFIEFLRDHLRTVVRIAIAVLVVLVLLDAVPAIVDKEHAHTAAEHIPAFWAAFGLLGCLVLVIVSKTFGHLFVSTREDYYDE